jgi:hypothetical protein
MSASARELLGLEPAPRPLSPAGLAVLGVSFVALVVTATLALPPAYDWVEVWRPGALALLAGQSPYDTVPYFSTPPWVAIALIPLALLPEALGQALVFVGSLIALVWAAHRLGAGRVATIAFILSPPSLDMLIHSNLEWLVLLGAVLPAPVGMVLVLVKPQIGAALALFWAIEAWRTSGWRGVLRVVGPVALLYLASFAVFGFWPAVYARFVPLAGITASLWPVALPVGMVLLAQALRSREPRWAMAAGPCLSPYVLFHSWIIALAAVLPDRLITLVAWAGIWVLVLLRVAGVD